jgi:hypothetical protein
MRFPVFPDGGKELSGNPRFVLLIACHGAK